MILKIREFNLTSIKNEKLKLRPFSLKFRLQFGQRLNAIRRFTRFWLNIRYKWRFFKNFRAKVRRRKKYHYMRVKEGIGYLKFLNFKKYSLINSKFCDKVFYNFSSKNSNLIQKILDKGDNKINFISRKIKRNQYYGQKKYRYLRYKALFDKRLKQRKKKILKKLNLRTKISLVNSWLPFFHKINIRKLFRRVGKKSIFYLKKFLKSWKIVNRQFFFCIYYWYAFYSFKVITSKVSKSNFFFFSPKKNFMNIGLDYKGLCNYIYIIINYKFFVSKFIFFLEKYKKKNLTMFLTKLIHNPWVVSKPKRDFEIDSDSDSDTDAEYDFNKLNIEQKNRRISKLQRLNSKKISYRNKLKRESIFHLFINGKYFLSSIYFYMALFYKTKIFQFNLNYFRYKKVLRNKFFLKNLLKVFYFKNKKPLINFSKIDFLKNNLLIIELPIKKNIIKKRIIKKKILKTVKKKKLKKVLKIKGFMKNIKFFTYFYFWLFSKENLNALTFRYSFTPYNLWIFFLSYSLNYYIFNKIYIVFFNYFFFIITQKFKQLILRLRLTGFQLCYEFVKYKDNSRYHLGIKPNSFVTTFNRRIKKGFQFLRFSGI